MPTNHIKQWKHNRSFLETIGPDYPDWAVTVIFYTALHAVDALFARDKVDQVTSHKARNATLMHTNRYGQIWKHYQPLHDMSRTIRYMADPARWVPWEKVATEILPRYLYPLEASVWKLAGFDQDRLPISMQTPENG